MTNEQIYREALERIAAFHDRVDIVEAVEVAEKALAAASAAEQPQCVKERTVFALLGDYGLEGQSLEGIYETKALAEEASREASDWAVEDWDISEEPVRSAVNRGDEQ